MSATNSPAHQARVLIVEDERALAGVVSSYLSRAGYGTSVVHTGPEAVEAARAQDPDVVVLDLGLPGMDGVEVLRRIRTFSDCYVVVVTARADEVDTLIGLSVGADDYVTNRSACASWWPGCRPCSADPGQAAPAGTTRWSPCGCSVTCRSTRRVWRCGWRGDRWT